MTVAQAFNLAFSTWKSSQEKKEKEKSSVSASSTICGPQTVCSITLQHKSCPEEDENLLIDLRSPADCLEDKTLAKAALVRLDSRDTDHDDMMDISFAK